MWKAITAKFFCTHSWTTHVVKEQNTSIFVIDSKGELTTSRTPNKTIEILKCNKCGTFHRLEY
jgi:hypothetical protein